MSATTGAMATRPVGILVREWRERRRLSQLALALDAGVSTRHLSFLETGKARPSREMVERLAERLDVPLRERNTLLLAAGFAPAYPEHRLDDPALGPARRVVDRVLAGHEPYPALAIDRHWTLLAANRAVAPLLAGVAPDLLRPPVNVLRLSLHPEGLAPRIANLGQWRAHLLERLRRQVEATADAVLAALAAELAAYPAPAVPAPGSGSGSGSGSGTGSGSDFAGIAVPLVLRTGGGTLAFLSTTTVFGTPVEVTLAELAIEAFFPADAATAAALRRTTGPTDAPGEPAR
ncbi:MAG TPA: helix-turn-helix transcriptional regulator [Thermomicrobiales bacterium]|nr:helix-turn-helix transcriptional regulator [Thermomicrobiales bacterium]